MYRYDGAVCKSEHKEPVILCKGENVITSSLNKYMILPVQYPIAFVYVPIYNMQHPFSKKKASSLTSNTETLQNWVLFLPAISSHLLSLNSWGGGITGNAYLHRPQLQQTRPCGCVSWTLGSCETPAEVWKHMGWGQLVPLIRVWFLLLCLPGVRLASICLSS